MEYNKIMKDHMKKKYAEQIVKWCYKDEYEVYNLPPYDDCFTKKYSITQKEKYKNYIVYILDKEVVFYINMKQLKNEKIYMGVGLKPNYCGKGLGNYFLSDSIKLVKEKYPNSILFLEVRSWNKRAIKSYEKLGFKVTNIIADNDKYGNKTEFVEMELPINN